jgi:hypothetical protein
MGRKYLGVAVFRGRLDKDCVAGLGAMFHPFGVGAEGEAACSGGGARPGTLSRAGTSLPPAIVVAAHPGRGYLLLRPLWAGIMAVVETVGEATGTFLKSGDIQVFA